MPAFGRREHVGEEQGGGREGGEEELVAGAEGAEVVEGGVGWLGGGEGEDGGEGCGAEGVGYALCGVSGAGEGGRGGGGGGGTVRRPREMVPTNFERVTVVDAILVGWRGWCGGLPVRVEWDGETGFLEVVLLAS